MTFNTGLAALQLFENICESEANLTINFTGGEPLLNFDVIRNLLKYIKTNKILKNARLVLFTNGTLLNTSMVELFRDNGFLVIVSLDGVKDIHDINRKFIDGTETYQHSLQGYLLAKKHGCNCAISSVADLSGKNFDVWLEWLIELSPASVGINYPHMLLKNKATIVDFSTYTSQILKAHKILGRNGISLENYDRFSKIYNQSVIRWRECQACGRGITIDANGNIGPCKSLLVSDIISYPLADTYPLENNEFIKWADRTPLNFDTCLNCPAVSICGGGCAYDAYSLYDRNILEMDRRLCSHIRTIFYDLLCQRVSSVREHFKDFLLIEPNHQETSRIISDSVGH